MAHQRQIIREYLQNNGRITGAIAFTELKVYRLSEYISRLRAEGMDIKTVMETDSNTGKEYGAYYLRQIGMAEGKKSFILYSDYQGLFNQLPDEIAGKLIKHLFAYVNDENPISEDLLLNVAFEPIKNQLKRDLKEWDETRGKRSESGTLGGLKSGETRRKQAEAKRSTASKNEANEAVTVTANVTETVTETKEIVLGDESPPQKTIEQREEDFRISLIPFVAEFSKETVRAFFEKWTEKNPRGKKMKFEMEKTFEIKKRLVTWKRIELEINQKNKSFGNDKPKQTTYDKLKLASEEARRIREKRRSESDSDGEESDFAHYTPVD